MLSPRRRFLALSLATIAVAAAACSGCANLQLSSAVSQAKPSGPTCTVVQYPAWGRPSQRTVSLDKPMTVQSAIESAGGFNRFSNYEVLVARTVPKTGETLRMGVEVDRGQIAPSTDYAVYPGDRILIKEQAGVIDQVIRSVKGE